MKVQFTPRARLDLAEYVTRIAEDDPVAARVQRDRVFAALGLLGERPEIGRSLSIRGMRRPARAWPVPPLILYYEPRPDALVILQIRHSARRSIER